MYCVVMLDSEIIRQIVCFRVALVVERFLSNFNGMKIQGVRVTMDTAAMGDLSSVSAPAITGSSSVWMTDSGK